MPTLRYYDQRGLLTPARVDDDTGYRYYTADQLSRLHRILALKDLGFSLAQIARVLEADVPVAELRGMLRLKQAEAQRLIDGEQTRLAHIAARLRYLEQEEALPAYDIVLKPVAPLLIASVRAAIPTVDDLGPLWGTLAAYLRDRDLPWAAPTLVVWHDTDGRGPEIDAEVATPLAAPTPSTRRVAVRTLPDVATMACAVHQGDYVGIAHAYAALYAWLDANGYRRIGPERQLHVRYEDGGDPATFVTEVQFPVSPTSGGYPSGGIDAPITVAAPPGLDYCVGGNRPAWERRLPVGPSFAGWNPALPGT